MKALIGRLGRFSSSSIMSKSDSIELQLEHGDIIVGGGCMVRAECDMVVWKRFVKTELMKASVEVVCVIVGVEKERGR